MPGNIKGDQYGEILGISLMKFSKHNTDAYLSTLYGPTYMQFPHIGIEHHGVAEGRAPLGDWAKNNNVDMSAIYNDLEAILNKL